MSISQIRAPDRISPETYTREKADFIADEFSRGVPVGQLCREYPDFLPGPMIVKRWRASYPAFDMLMKEAGEVRAEELIESTRETARDPDLQAAQARNIIAVDEKLAGYLDRKTYGSGGAQSVAQVGSVPVYLMSDDELLALASGKLRDVSINGECERLPGPRVPPPGGDDRGTLYEEPSSKKPANIPARNSVTTSYDPEDYPDVSWRESKLPRRSFID